MRSARFFGTLATLAVCFGAAAESVAIVSDERFGYDKSGRLAYHSRVQTPLGRVETRLRYDALGREIERSVTKANVNGTPATLVARTETDLGARTITRHDPAVSGAGAEAKEVTTLDRLGRPARIERSGAATPGVVKVLGYDFSGQVSYESDTVRSAVLRQHDAVGNLKATVASNATTTETTWSAWSEPRVQIARDANDALIARTRNVYTAKGRLRSVNEELTESGPARHTHFGWTGSGVETVRTGVVANVNTLQLGTGHHRTQRTERDLAGRVESTRSGLSEHPSGLIVSSEETFAETRFSGYRGALPDVVTTREPRVGAEYPASVAHDALGRATEVVEADGAYTTKTRYDESGNVLELERPGMNAETAVFDSRGLPTRQTTADGKQLHYIYDARGVLRERRDEAGESTFYETDALGRVTEVRYADNSFEQTVYEAATGAVKATRDRGGQWLSYTYDAGGRVTAIKNGDDPNTAADLVQYEYDAAGRLKLVKNKDAGIAYDEYDFLGRPGVVKTYRYMAGTGLSLNPAYLDVHTGKHGWSVYGERTTWSMPAAGSSAPGSDDPASPWLQNVVETRDGGGNLVEQEKGSGASLSEAFGRSGGRLMYRKRATNGGGAIATQFRFADGVTPPSSPEFPPIEIEPATTPRSGLLRSSQTSIGNVKLGGSAMTRDGARRVESARDLGLGRTSAWNYDARGRLFDWSLIGQATVPSTNTFIDADFRERRTVAPLLTTSQHTLLGDEALKLEPLTWTQTKTSVLHQEAARTLYLDGEERATVAYAFDDAGRRTTSGDWTTAFDELGRVTSITSTTEGRRIEYTWDPNNRMVGRTAYRLDGGTAVAEDRPAVLAADGLPAKTTFVWDPTVDRLVAVYVEGASTVAGAAPTAGLLRQYLHGGQGYDDPTRVLIAATPGGAPSTYLPILDDATGSLSAVADGNGNLVERVLYGDAYGDAPRYLHGPVVDGVWYEAKKNGAGALERVEVRAHISDAINAATVAGGARLTVVKADGSLALTSTLTPELEGERTLLWTLAASAWNALTTAPGAESIEVAVSRDLNAMGWGATPVMPLPAWARTLYSGTDASSRYPVIVRERVSVMTAFVATIPNGGEATHTSYALKSLYLAAKDESKAKLLTGFKAAPFVEPATGLVMLRDRWYDPATGSWLTPDAESYSAGSSNLYAGFNGDPVNNVDPDGNEPFSLAVYTGWAALNTAIDTGIDYAFHRWLGEGEFNWGKSFGTNFAVNFATAGIGGKVAKLRHLQHINNPIARRAVAEGIEYTADVGVTGTVDMAYGENASSAYGSAAFGGLVGRGISHGAGAIWKHASFDFDLTVSGSLTDVHFVPRFDTPFTPLRGRAQAQVKEKVLNRTATRDEWRRLAWTRRMKARRDAGVDRFWALERQRLSSGLPGTRNWSTQQRGAILAGYTPKFGGESMEGHHLYNVADYPHLANDPYTIFPATRSEHFNRFHSGDWAGTTYGHPRNGLYPFEF